MWRVVLVTLLGCGRLGFDPAAASDASIDVPGDVVATCSTFGPWSSPQPLSALNTPSLEYRPALSTDQLTLVYQSNVVGGEYDLYRATRATTAESFTNSITLTALNSSASDGQAELAADGLTLYFSSNRNGGVMRLYRATRASTSDDFVTFAMVSELASTIVFGASLTADGRELFFNDDTPSTLQRARITGTSISVLGPVTELNTPDAGWSSFVGNDTVFFTSSRGGDFDIYTASRDGTGVFGAAALVPGADAVNGDDDDPEVSRDGTTLIFSSNRGGVLNADLYMMTRSCL